MNNVNYRADIDGLRAIAVISVLLVHLEFNMFSGGFIGVDIFFVISGYLITSILIENIKKNTFSLIEFYEKRIRRIFPALFAVILVSSLVGYFLLLPDDYKNFGQSIAATSVFSSNILFWMESGYFDTDAKLKPLLHTWSLGIEEQFYLLLPVILFLLYKFFKTKIIIFVIFIITLFSLILSINGSLNFPRDTFFLIHTRAWELLIGSLLALKIIPINTNNKINNILSVLGISLILYAIFTYDKYTVFPGLGALIPVFGSALIIYSGAKDNFISKFLSIKPMVFIGLISYSLYLWHWPLIVFYKYYHINSFETSDKIILGITSIIIAIISWKFVEKPFRYNKGFWNRKRIFLFAIMLMISTIGYGVFLHKTKGFVERIPNEVKEIIISNEKAKNDWQFPVDCDNFKLNPDKFSDINVCSLVKGEKQNRTLVWGDSHIEMLYPLFKELHKENSDKYNFDIVTSGGCLPMRGFNQIEKGYFCNKFNDITYNQSFNKEYSRIIIGSKWDYYGNSLNNTNEDELTIIKIFNEFKKDVLKLKTYNKEIIIILPIHRYENSPAIQLQKMELFKKHDSSKYIIQIDKNISFIRDLLIDFVHRENLKVIDPQNALMINNNYLYEINGISIFKDDDHLNSKGALMLKDEFIRVINE